jgi:hypothetical protein
MARREKQAVQELEKRIPVGLLMRHKQVQVQVNKKQVQEQVNKKRVPQKE